MVKRILTQLFAASIMGLQILPHADAANDSTLTHKDSGLYGNIRFWHGQDPATENLQNLLSAERAASGDAPWSFYILQGNFFSTAPSAEDIGQIQQMAEKGVKIILRIKLGEKVHAAFNFERASGVLESVLGKIDPSWLYAITLDEENVYWDGNIEVLSKLYHWSKKRWPSLSVYQWWTPMEVPNVRTKNGWVALPADGWIIDLYGMKKDRYEKQILKTLETGVPVVAIVWSSPEWLEHSGGKNREDAIQVFQDQIGVCRTYNIPVAHFCAEQAVVRNGKRVEDIRWGWHAKSEDVLEWYRHIETLAKEKRRLPETTGLHLPTREKFDWAHEWLANEKKAKTSPNNKD